MTTQRVEILIVDGKRVGMDTFPPLPKDGWVVKSNIPESDMAGILSTTACWRQYIGTWEIKDNKFYLVGLEGRYKISGTGPIFADWFTGELKITRGNKEVQKSVFGPNFYRGHHIAIENGIVTQRFNVSVTDVEQYDLFNVKYIIS